MIIFITVLCLLLTQASLKPQEDYSSVLKSDQLYYSIQLGQYISAVRTATELQVEGKGNVIKSVINRLLSEGQINAVYFGLKLVRMGHVNIVNSYIPVPLRWILTGEEVIFINRRDRMGLKLEWGTDRDGDRGAFGDRNEWNGKRMAWKIIPHWYKSQQIFFEIVNVGFNQYLKLENSADGDGEHKAFGGNEHDTWRHQWIFHPVVVGGETMFYIINRKFNQPLKLGRYVDGAGDRRAWGNNGSPLGNPELFAWQVRLHRDYE